MKQFFFFLTSTVLMGLILAIAPQAEGGEPYEERRQCKSLTMSQGETLTLEQLKNATYSGFEGLTESVTLVDGKWEGKPYTEGGVVRPQVSFVGDIHLIGDLNNDGKDESVVLLEYWPGGTGHFLHLAVVAYQQGKLENVATALVGDRVQIRKAQIENGRIVLELVEAGPKDAACCPGNLATRQWSLSSADSLSEVAAATDSGRLSLETLSSTEWVLKAWNLNEPVPEQPPVTLTFKKGRFLGSSGCNRYFAPVQPGYAPGDVTVGVVGATRRACPEAIMTVEDRFLKYLSNVNKFSFFIEQLALSYQEDGASKVMLFEASPTAARE